MACASAEPSLHPLVLGVLGPTSLDDLKKGAAADGDCGSDPTEIPPWMDMTRYQKTTAFFLEHAFSITLVWHCSLVIGFSLPSLLTAVDFTHMSDTPKKALQRYMRTFDALRKWHTGNIWDPSTGAYTSVQETRQLHKTVRGHMESQLPGHKWITMYDMPTVQSGFMGGTIMAPEKFGLRVPQQALDDYVFFWKCVGHQLGIDDRFNLCSLERPVPDNIVHQITNEVILPGIAHPPPHYAATAAAYISGINLVLLGFPLFSVNATNAMTFWALGLHYGHLSCTDKLRFYFLRAWAFMAGRLPIVRRLLSWAIISTVDNNEDFWKRAAMVPSCPFSGRLINGDRQSEDLHLKQPTAIALVLLSPMALCILLVLALPWRLLWVNLLSWYTCLYNVVG